MSGFPRTCPLFKPVSGRPGGFPEIWLLSGFSPSVTTIVIFLLLFRVIYYKNFRELNTEREDRKIRQQI